MSWGKVKRKAKSGFGGVSRQSEDGEDEDVEVVNETRRTQAVVPHKGLKNKSLPAAKSSDMEENEDDDYDEEIVAERIDRAKKTLSTFGIKSNEIKNLLRRDENENAISVINKQLLITLIDLVPVAESKLREAETTRGIYQFNALVSQIREMLADLQATQDSQLLVSRLCHNILLPAFTGMGQVMLDGHNRLKQQLRDYVPDNRVRSMENIVDMVTRELATHFTSTYGTVSGQIQTALTEED